MAEDAPLLEVAAAVVAGSKIDWDKVNQTSTDERERAVISELRMLERMARAMRADGLLDVPELDGPDAPDSVEHWGHLHVLEELGQGAFGIVYRAWDERLECEVALKLAKPSGLSRDVDKSNALNEARLLARVRHTNVVKVYGADRHDDRNGLWMELVTGRTLEQVLASSGPMSAQEVTHVGVDLCHALAAVHRAGLVHRDLKATNVMREDGGRILLMDFGTGRPFPTPDDPVQGIAGTPRYLAPEVFFGEDPSPASDIYSLAVLLYHLVTGSYPTDAHGLDRMRDAHQRKERLLLRDARPDLPSPFIDVIERALSFSPNDRYPTAGAFGNALAAAAGIRQRDNDPVPRPATRPPLRWKFMAPAVAVGVVALAIALKVGWTRDTTRSPVSAGASQAAAERVGAPGVESPTPATYQVEAAFFALRDGQRVRLAKGSRVAPGDKLFLTLDVSRPVFVYIINQDDLGVTNVEFPLPGQRELNPVSMGRHQLPGPSAVDGREMYWEVTTAGGVEHFFVYVTPERQNDFENLMAGLPRAALGKQVTNPPLSREAVGILRSVGGLTAAGPSGPAAGPTLDGLAPLPDGPDAAAHGVWARQITFGNPVK